MDETHSDLDHFIHALISPLTALNGTTGLLKRRCGSVEDGQVRALLAAVQRNIARLEQVCNVLIEHAQQDGDALSIRLPFAALHAQPTAAARQARPPGIVVARLETSAAQLPAAHEPARILLIADGTYVVEQLGERLQEVGHTLLKTTDAFAAVDLARHALPDLIIADEILPLSLQSALHIIATDPDTKQIPLALLRPQLTGEPYNERLVQIADVVLEPETALRAITAMMAQGRVGHANVPHILIVDDEPDLRELVALQFQQGGYTTSMAESGTEAFRMVRNQHFDLIVLDLMLPDMDGFTVLGGLRAQISTALTPIILLSALNSPEEKVRGLHLGADDYVTKPFVEAELLARVEAALRRSEREGGANPSTRLPGNLAIEREIARRIDHQEVFAVCYCDLDNFKAYNDHYGFLKGDAVIQRTAQILVDAVRAVGNHDDFVGHIGGDDFVVITNPAAAAEVCRTAISAFDAVVPLFYDPEARGSGYIAGIDRQGHAAIFPLLSISIGVVSNASRPFSHPGEVAQRSIDAKKMAKRTPRSAFVVHE
jgi:DNA-binding response OmpR family regulator